MGIEEGTPLIASEVKPEVKAVNRRPLIIAAALATLATTACVGYATMSNNNGPYPGFAGDFKIDQAMSLSVDGKRTNEAAKASIVTDSASKLKHLQGETVTVAIKDLDLDGGWTQDKNSKYSYVVDLFDKVSKVSYKKDGSIDQKFDLGHFSGLDGEANAIFTDGDFCSTDGGPFVTRVSFVCGPELRISTVHMRTACLYNIAIKTPDQCKPHTVNRIGTDEERKAAKAKVWAIYGEGPLAEES